MIKVLRGWQEIGEATKFIKRRGLPEYLGCEKNWDLVQLFNIVHDMPRGIKIVDLGCGNLEVLKFLSAAGFANLFGMDLHISLRCRISQAARMARARGFSPPFRLKEGNIVKTGFPDGSFDLAVCVSVIEHGVDIDMFLREASRILARQGILFITTDYWDEHIDVGNDIRPFGLPWKVFSKQEIETLLERSAYYGFTQYQHSVIPPCSDKCIVWRGKEYTFLSIVLVKR